MRALALALVATAAAAQSPLDAVAAGLGLDASVAAVEVRAETRATVGGGEVAVPSTRATRRGAVRWRTEWGGATRTVTVDASGVVAEAEGGRVRLDGRAAADVRLAAWLDPLALALRRGALDARDLGAGLVRVRPPGLAEPIVLKLDAAGRPVRLSTFVVRGGERAYVEVVLRDWRETDGVWVPRQVVRTEGGVVRGTTTVRAVTVERTGG